MCIARITPFLCAFSVTAALSAQPAAACEFGYCWGAVGFGPNGVVGYATRKSNAPEAGALVQQACGEKCTVVEVFHDSCAALASGPDQGFRLGVGTTRAEAETDALSQCRDMNWHCVTRVSACSK